VTASIDSLRLRVRGAAIAGAAGRHRVHQTRIRCGANPNIVAAIQQAMG
jgi:hypothetical protein